jgi:hypothetical protein
MVRLTVWQPFGLKAQECPASKGRRDACPTLRKCLGHSARTRGGYAAANEDSECRVGDGEARFRGDSSAWTRNLTRYARVLEEGRRQVRSEKSCVTGGESPSSLEAELPEFRKKVMDGKV